MSETKLDVYLLVNHVVPVDIPNEVYEALYPCKENTFAMTHILDRSNVDMLATNMVQ